MKRAVSCAAAALLLAGCAVPSGSRSSGVRPAPAPAPGGEPPEEMIDFLGRRMLCLKLADDLPNGDAEPGSWHERRWGRLRCDAVSAEEAALRARHAGDGAALAWLDSDPRKFELPRFVVVSREWNAPAEARQLELGAVHPGSGRRFRVLIDAEAAGGPSVRLAGDGRAPLDFRLDRAKFPDLDLQAAEVWLDPRPGRDEIFVDIPFGDRRGYCGFHDPDDRPRILLVFADGAVSAEYQDMTNCRGEWIEIEPEEAALAGTRAYRH